LISLLVADGPILTVRRVEHRLLRRLPLVGCFGVIAGDVDIARIHIVQHIVHAHVKAHGGGHRHQHHGGEDADAGKAAGIFLHAVQHTGDRGEMLRLIIIAFVRPQTLEEHDAESGEQKIGADDDADDRDKKQRDRGGCGFGHDGHGVASAKKENTEYSEYPLGFRLPLALLRAVQQFHRLGKVDNAQGIEQRQEKDSGEQKRRDADGGGAHIQAEADVKAQNPQKQELHEL